MATRVDNFNRSNNTTLGTPSGGGSAWVDSQSLYGISSNRAYIPSLAGATSPETAYLESSVSDVDVQLTINVLGPNQCGIHARYVDDNNHFAVWMKAADNTVQFQRIQAGAFTSLGSSPRTFVAGDTIKATVRANVWNIYLNGSLIIGPVTDAFQNTATKGGLWRYGGDNTALEDDFSITDQSASATVAFTDNAGNAITTLPSNHGAGTVTVKAVGTGTTFTSGDTWTVGSLSGWSLNTKTFVDTTHYTLLLNCPAAADPPAGATGTLTLNNTTQSVSNTLAVHTPTVSFVPTSGAISTTPSLTITGGFTLWANETAAGLFAVTGGTGASIGTPSGITNTGATDVLTTGSATGPLSVHDTSTGAKNTFSVQRTTPANFFVRGDGNDSNAGTADTSGGAWLTVSQANTGPAGGYIAGDTLAFDGAAGANFSGNVTWGTSGTQAARCIISGTNGANIQPGNGTGVAVTNAEFVTVQNLTITGSGVSSSDGSTTSTGWGILFFDNRTSGSQWRDNRVLGCTITGTQSGIGFKTPTPDTSPSAVVGFEGISVKGCTIHDIQRNAVITLGGSGSSWLQAPPYYTTSATGVFKGVYIGYCTVYNVFGASGVYDRTMWLLNTIGGMVERCVVHNCGLRQAGLSDNAQIMWEVSSYCVIQYCEAYSNSGGSVLDLDLQTDNCIIQYCYTHDNDGAGLMDYGSGVGNTNTIRYCVSRNDTGNQDGAPCRLGNAGKYHNNTIISDSAIVVPGTIPLVLIQGSCLFANNILVGNNSLKLISITSGTPTIVGNLYYTGSPSTAVFDGTITTLAGWQGAGHESVDGRTFGVIGNPLLIAPAAGVGTGTLPGSQVCTITSYDPAGNSPALAAGCPPELLNALFGPIDFHGYPARTSQTIDIGAISYGASSLLPTASGGGVVGSRIFGGL